MWMPKPRHVTIGEVAIGVHSHAGPGSSVKRGMELSPEPEIDAASGMLKIPLLICSTGSKDFAHE